MVKVFLPITVEGVNYYSLGDFAALVELSTKTISHLCNKGNAFRKMKCINLLDRPLIPESELWEFPFTGNGNNSKQREYHFVKVSFVASADGEVTLAKRRMSDVRRQPTLKLDDPEGLGC